MISYLILRSPKSIWPCRTCSNAQIPSMQRSHPILKHWFEYSFVIELIRRYPIQKRIPFPSFCRWLQNEDCRETWCHSNVCVVSCGNPFSLFRTKRCHLLGRRLRRLLGTHQFRRHSTRVRWRQLFRRSQGQAWT